MSSRAKFAGLACVFVAWSSGISIASNRIVSGAAARDAGGPALDWKSEAGIFRDALAAFRAGDESQLSPLAACAERCASERPDFKAVARFYASLSAAERKAGFEREARFTDIYTSLQALRSKRPSTEEWRAARVEFLKQLDEIVRESRGAADFSPAARALALRSTLMRQRIVEDFEMDEATRLEWVRAGIRDAEESLTLFGRTGHVTPRLEALLSLAWFDWSRGDWSAAEEQFEEVLALARRVGQAGYEDRALTGLLRIAHESGDLQAVSRLLDQVARTRDPATSFDLTSRQAGLLLALDQPGRAAEFLSRNRPKDDASLLDWHALMKACLTRTGDLEAAAAHEKVLQSVVDTNPLARLAVVEARVQRGEFELALADLDAFPWNERAPVSERLSRERLRGTAQLNLGQRAHAIATFERALTLGDSIESRLTGAERLSPTASISGEVVGLETTALLARAHIENGEALQAAAAIEDRQSRAIRFASSGPDGARVDVASLRAWAAAYELGLVTWVVGADTTVVVHVARDGSAAGSTVKIGRKSVEDGVRRLREAVMDADEDLAREYARDVQEALFRPELEKRLASSTGRLLILVHGPLERLPVEMLPLFERSGTREIVPLVLPGLVALSPGIGLSSHAQVAWSILGDPLDERGAARLPGVGAELRELAQIYGTGTLCSADKFDRSCLSAALATDRALHIATHLTRGLSAASSLDTGLAHAAFELSNGERFDRNDVLRARPRLPLVVLSACESAAGEFVDGEAAIGVAKAFLESGTRNLLVTSWPVEDQAARRFTVAFHRALKAGALPSQAAVEARAASRAAGAPMSDWAAFRLLGRD